MRNKTGMIPSSERRDEFVCQEGDLLVPERFHRVLRTPILVRFAGWIGALARSARAPSWLRDAVPWRCQLAARKGVDRPVVGRRVHRPLRGRLAAADHEDLLAGEAQV